jgi:alkylated DNA nucleotide flippase Atl1
MTNRALMAIAEDAAATAPWWRIVKPDGAMMAYFPGGPAAQANRLKTEGSTQRRKAE